MAELGQAIRDYLKGDAQTMQIATLDGDQPWICTVWFVVDDDLNLYWVSRPSRRHSQEIIQHDKVAAAIVVKPDMPTIGIQLEGRAEQVSDLKIVERVMKDYVAKYGQGDYFYERMKEGINIHYMYRIKPTMFVLIDDVKFAAEGRTEWRP